MSELVALLKTGPAGNRLGAVKAMANLASEGRIGPAASEVAVPALVEVLGHADAKGQNSGNHRPE
jgi:hypothetical protein